jgi:hypothetical protein
MKAFPWGHNQSIDGMDLRDYFAAKAMQGFVTAETYHETNIQSMVNASYLFADYMMEARNATK